jgi:signal peptidase I
MKRILEWIEIFAIQIAHILFNTDYEVVRVSGESMLPTLCEGQFVLIKKVYKPKDLKPLDLYVFTNPDALDVIKRLMHTDKGIIPKCWFEGDNKDHSYDSRQHGYVPIMFVQGRIMKQYSKPKGSVINSKKG